MVQSGVSFLGHVKIESKKKDNVYSIIWLK